ncbi:MAG: HlyD family secretion protein [Myxococcaceae bacterium]
MRRGPSHRSSALALALVALGSGALAADDPGAAELFTGFSVAANATDVYAPESNFRVMGWSSSSGQTKLMELAPDGQQVKAGQLIARFEFPGRDALRWINERIQRADAEAAQSKLAAEQALEALFIEKRRKELEARLAGINVEKERSVSKRQAELYKIVRKVADFEVEATTQRIASTQRSKAAETGYQDLTVKRAKANLARYAFYERRYQVNAPHDGVVRHAFNSNERRKAQKGDALQSGQKVMSVARDATLAVKFFVPEHRIGEIAEGAEVTVSSPASAEELVAVVKSIDFFPQELGFLMENRNLPNGREKAFAVTATFAADPAGLSAGTELKVKARAR